MDQGEVEQTGEKQNRLEICRIDYKIDSVEQTREKENGLKRSRIQSTKEGQREVIQKIEINKNRDQKMKQKRIITKLLETRGNRH